MIKNKKVFIAALLIFCMFCCCAFSYAAYSSQLTASGTVAASGSFDVQFNTTANAVLYNENGISVKVKSIGEDDAKDDATHTSDKLVLDITLNEGYNSSKGFTFNVPVKNFGTVDAVASAINPATKGVVTLSATEVSLTPVGTSGATGNIAVTLKTSGAINEKIDGIELTIVYKQHTIDPAPTAAHKD